MLNNQRVILSFFFIFFVNIPWDSHDMSRLIHHRSNGESFLNAENVSDTAPPPSGKRPGEPGGASGSPALKMNHQGGI